MSAEQALKEELARALDNLSHGELAEVATFLQFVRFRSRLTASPFGLSGKGLSLDERELASLYAESAEEDRTLAEQGMDDYASTLAREDREGAA